MSEVQFTELPFEKFVLPNGLTVILRQDRSVPVVSPPGLGRNRFDT